VRVRRHYDYYLRHVASRSAAPTYPLLSLTISQSYNARQFQSEHAPHSEFARRCRTYPDFGATASCSASFRPRQPAWGLPHRSATVESCSQPLGLHRFRVLIQKWPEDCEVTPDRAVFDSLIQTAVRFSSRLGRRNRLLLFRFVRATKAGDLHAVAEQIKPTPATIREHRTNAAYRKHRHREEAGVLFAKTCGAQFSLQTLCSARATAPGRDRQLETCFDTDRNRPNARHIALAPPAAEHLLRTRYFVRVEMVVGRSPLKPPVKRATVRPFVDHLTYLKLNSRNVRGFAICHITCKRRSIAR